MTFPRRGEIYLVDFDPGRGHEIQKTRPAVIIQNDIGNRHSPVTIVAAVTSKLSPTPYPVEVGVTPNKGNGLTLPSAINLGQIRSVDRGRLVKRIGALDVATMRQVDDALKISLGLSGL
jgi:mRNA interferase MazF